MSDDLHDAAKAGDVKQLETLLGAKNVNATNKFGATPLHMAAGAGKLAAVKLLLARGAKVDVAADGGTTALHNATSSGKLDVIAALIAAGAKIDAPGKFGNSPWFYAKDVKVAQALADAGANLALKNEDGHTAPEWHKILDQHARAKMLAGIKRGKAPRAPIALDWKQVHAGFAAFAAKAVKQLARQAKRAPLRELLFDADAEEADLIVTAVLAGKPAKRLAIEPPEALAELRSEIRDAAAPAKFLEVACAIALELEADGAFAELAQAKGFRMLVRDHDETEAAALARLKRARKRSK